MVSCRAKGENSTSLSLQSPWKSWSSSPRIVRSTKALAFFRWELNNPLMDVTNPSPAPSLGRFINDTGSWSPFPAWPPSLSLRLRSVSGIIAWVSFWLCDFPLNFLPYTVRISERGINLACEVIIHSNIEELHDLSNDHIKTCYCWERNEHFKSKSNQFDRRFKSSISAAWSTYTMFATILK